MSESDSITPTKVCPKCGREYPATLEHFYRDKARKSGLCCYCMECTRARNLAYQVAHPDKVADRKRAWRVANPGYLRAWHAANPEKEAEYSRTYRVAHLEQAAAYRAEHAEAIAERKRDDRAAHPEKFAERGRVYYAENREKIAVTMRAYAAEHAEDIAAYKRVWCASHSEEILVYVRNRKARKLGNGGTHTAEDIEAQYERQKGRCFYCDVKVGKKYHVDHVTPLMLGGSNGPENLVIACPACNLSKGAKHPQNFAGRLL